MTTLFIIATIIILAYPIYFKVKHDITYISESYYFLESIKKGLGLIFTIWCVAPAFLLFPVWVEIMPKNLQFIAFLNVVALAGVGCAPRFKSLPKKQHYIFAILTIILAIASSCILGVWQIPLIMLLPTILISFKKRDFIFWVEFEMLLSLIITLSIYL